jgi:HlyD family secretion protein
VKRALTILTILAAVGWLGYSHLAGSSSARASDAAREPAATWPSDSPDVAFCAPGVTEPASRAVQIFSELPGTIGKMYVRSGDRIRAGQPLFELVSDTQQAEVKAYEAQVYLARAELAKLESWDRPEDREVARAQWAEAKAMLERAEYELGRVRSLKSSSAATDKELFDVQSELRVAQAREAVAKARYDRSTAGPRPEELALARAKVTQAESQLRVTQSTLDKTRIGSPIDGVVLYRFREVGESVFPNVPAPVVSIGNRDVLHIRVDVDELDLGKVRPGQRVFATCDAFGSRRFDGTVVEIAQTMGRKNFRTDRPTERADTKILEVVVALDDGRDLPVELQMAVWFLRGAVRTGPVSAASGDHTTGRPAAQAWGGAG